MKETVEKHHKDNSAGVVGLVLGIFAVLLGVPGILLGFIGFWFSLNQHKKGKNRWTKWGLTLNILGFVIGMVIAVYVAYTTASNYPASLQGLSVGR